MSDQSIQHDIVQQLENLGRRSRLKDLSGQKFGSWTVLSLSPLSPGVKSTGAFWLCRCVCGTERIVVGKTLRNGTSVSCGCFRHEATQVEKRLLDKVVRPASGCWEWVGSRDKAGYGLLRGLGVTKAHRVSYVLFCGPIPDSLCVCHHCDNPCCVRPDHLFLGTNADNTADMVSKGRQRRGEDVICPTAKRRLTTEEVRSIRRRLENGETPSLIAKSLGINPDNVRHILHRNTWKHVI